MNPTTGQTTLDPKLKEAYDRVMGTATTSSQPVPPQIIPTSPINTDKINEQKIEEPVMHEVPAASPVISINQTTPETSQKTDLSAQAGQKSKGISPIILMVGGVAFFISYAVVWLKLFKVM